jgi:hypothetical protein
VSRPFKVGKWYKVRKYFTASISPLVGERLSAWERRWRTKDEVVSLKEGSLLMITDYMFADEVLRFGYGNRFLFAEVVALETLELLEEINPTENCK